MRIIHITAKPPYPIVDGGCYASARLLEDLHQLNLEVIHVSLTTHKHPGNKELYPNHCKNIHFFPVDTEISVFGALKSFLKGSSYNIDRFKSIVFNQFMQLQVNSSDIVIIDGLFASTFMDDSWNHNGPTILRAHNVEYKIWESIALQTKSKFSADEENKTPFFKRFYTKYLSRKLKRYELDIAQKVDLVWTLSNEDSLELSAHGVETKLIPVSVELSQKDHDYSKNPLYHIGGMEWSPNRSAIYILQDLMRKMNDDAVKLHLIGSGIQESDQKNIIVHGFVEDLESLLSEMGILVAPIISGSGIRIKILESMAQGIPVITTSMGAKGILDKNILAIGDDPETFTNKIKEFVYSKETRERFGRLGKEYIRIHHNTAVISTEIRDSLKLNTIDLNQKNQ